MLLDPCSTPTQHDLESTVGCCCCCICITTWLLDAADRRAAIAFAVVANIRFSMSVSRLGSRYMTGSCIFYSYPSTFSHQPTTVMRHCIGGPWASSGANSYPHSARPGRVDLQDQGPRTAGTVELLLSAAAMHWNQSCPHSLRFVPFTRGASAACVHVKQPDPFWFKVGGLVGMEPNKLNWAPGGDMACEGEASLRYKMYPIFSNKETFSRYLMGNEQAE